MDARDLGAADIVGGALGFVGGPIGRRVRKQREELREIHDLDELRLLGGAAGRRTEKNRGESKKSNGSFHSQMRPSACTRLTLTRRFVKTRSVWRGKWTLILIVLAALAVR